MEDFAAILGANPFGSLATIADGGVRSRMFEVLFMEGAKAYFCTRPAKRVFAELQANPNAAFCSYSKDYSIVANIRGKAVFTEDLDIKRKILAMNPIIKSLFAAAENPDFAVFFIDICEARTFTLREGERHYKL